MVDDQEYLQTIICGGTAFELLRTGLELEVFELLEEAGGMSVGAAAAVLGLQRQPARILLLGLAALGLLGKEGTRYVNTELARQRLLRSAPGYLGRVVEVQARIVNPGIAGLAESLRRNTNVGLGHLDGPGTTLYERITAHPELQRAFYANIGDVSRKTFPIAVGAHDFSGLTHVVDVGGGDGTNALVLAHRNPHLRVTVFDQGSAHLAERKAKEAGFADRIGTWVGDFFTDPFPEGIDGILLCHVFEMWSLERNTALLRRCYEALPEGGAVLVYNFVSDAAGTGPVASAFMSAYFMTIASGEGMVYSAPDVERAVRAAGFSDIERHEENVGFEHALVVGRKAA